MTATLAGKVCPKCGYKRSATESAPDWQCPKCGVVYAKAEGGSADTTAPMPRYAAPARSAAPSGPVAAITAAFAGYVDFSGRATRSEYWWFFLFCVLVPAGLAVVNYKLGAVAWLVILLPSITVLVRRLHDAGKSGWWWFIGFIPVVGPLILLYFAVQPSDGDNDYGTAAA